MVELFAWAFFALVMVGVAYSLRPPVLGVVARLLSYPVVTNWLYAKAKRTPYSHIVKNGDLYMERYWLFNPYDNETRVARFNWIPFSIRLHWIVRPDQDRHLHDHPWNARTFILRGGYMELRNGTLTPRYAGSTAQLRFGQFHRITHVFPGGALTLFITGRYRGTWGFDVDGHKVPWREYLAVGQEIKGD